MLMGSCPLCLQILYLTVFTAWWCMPMPSPSNSGSVTGSGKKMWSSEEVRPWGGCVAGNRERQGSWTRYVFSFSFLSSISLPLSFFLSFVSHCHRYHGILIKPTTGIYPDCEYNPAPGLLPSLPPLHPHHKITRRRLVFVSSMRMMEERWWIRIQDRWKSFRLAQIIFRRRLRGRGGDRRGVAAGRGFSRCIWNRPQRRGMCHMQVLVWVNVRKFSLLGRHTPQAKSWPWEEAILCISMAMAMATVTGGFMVPFIVDGQRVQQRVWSRDRHWERDACQLSEDAFAFADSFVSYWATSPLRVVSINVAKTVLPESIGSDEISLLPHLRPTSLPLLPCPDEISSSPSTSAGNLYGKGFLLADGISLSPQSNHFLPTCSTHIPLHKLLRPVRRDRHISVPFPSSFLPNYPKLPFSRWP